MCVAMGVILDRATKIINYINDILKSNVRTKDGVTVLDSVINFVEFELIDNKGCYATEQFRGVLDAYFSDINATYSYKTVRKM